MLLTVPELAEYPAEARSLARQTAVLGLLLSGCSASAAPPASEMAALEQTELHFSLDQCEPLEANLYKCPAVDKPVCSPDYNGQLECVRVGAKGNVFVAEALE